MTPARVILAALVLLGLTGAVSGGAAGPGVNGRIVFERHGFSTSGSEVWTMSQDGSDLRPVGPGRDPAWSPDGRRVAFIGENPANGAQDGALWVMDVDGSDRHMLATGATGYWVVGPAWSPDGGKIAFGDAVGLYTVAPSGGPVTSLAPEFFARWKPSSAVLPKPSWSPDGARLAFVTPDGSVNVVRSDGSEPHSLTGGSRVASASTAVGWSPDGTTIAYSDDQGGISTIGVTRGAPVKVIASNGTSFGSPVWSPDGRRLAFDSNNSDICVVDADGTNLGRLTFAPVDPVRGAAGNLEPSWLSLPLDSSPAGGAVPAGPAPDWDRDDAWAWACDARVFGRELSVAAIPVRTAPGRRVTFRIRLANAGATPIGTNGLVGFAGRLEGGFRYGSVTSSQGSCRLSRQRPQEGIECALGALFPGERATVAWTVRATTPGELVLTAFLPYTEGMPPEHGHVWRVPVSGCTIRGSENADTIAGSRRADVVCALDGDDRIRPGAGADIVYAGPGDDVVIARDGVRDHVFCGSGKDSVVADQVDAVARDCEARR